VIAMTLSETVMGQAIVVLRRGNWREDLGWEINGDNLLTIADEFERKAAELRETHAEIQQLEESER